MTAPPLIDEPDSPLPEDGDGPPTRSHVARNTALVVGAVLILFIAVLATRKPPEDVKNQLVGRRVPALAGQTLKGDRLDIDSLLARPESGVAGKWVVVNFLASWCVGCIEEHPDLIRFADAHPDDVQIVGVAYEDEADDLREFFRVKGGDWPVILSERNAAAYDFGVTGVPESFVVAPSGVVVAWSQGVTYEWLEQVLATTGGSAQMTDPGRPIQRTWVPWVPLFLVLGLALVIGALGSRGPVTDEDRVLALSRLVQCPQCDGETASESNSIAARNLRLEIDQQVRAGRTDEQILASIETQYPGRNLTPPSSGLAGLVWVVPVVAFVLALGGLAVAFRRWGARAPARASDADRALVEQALGES